MFRLVGVVARQIGIVMLSLGVRALVMILSFRTLRRRLCRRLLIEVVRANFLLSESLHREDGKSAER